MGAKVDSSRGKGRMRSLETSVAHERKGLEDRLMARQKCRAGGVLMRKRETEDDEQVGLRTREGKVEDEDEEAGEEVEVGEEEEEEEQEEKHEEEEEDEEEEEEEELEEDEEEEEDEDEERKEGHDGGKAREEEEGGEENGGGEAGEQLSLEQVGQKKKEVQLKVGKQKASTESSSSAIAAAAAAAAPAAATTTVAAGASAPTEAEQQGKKRKRKLSQQQVQEAGKQHKTGVCYLSRIPPHMKPMKLRHLLSKHAAIGRIYLAPEDASVRLRRKQAGGNRGKSFTEGWVEFERKRDAKQIAELLNGQPMGGGHRSAYRYDLWNIKYLKRFKWDHLTEEIAYRNAVREQKLATELRAAAKERDFYLQQVDRSKAQRAMEEKRSKKVQKQEQEQSDQRPTPSNPSVAAVKRTFLQRHPVDRVEGDAKAKQGRLLSSDLLSKVFG